MRNRLPAHAATRRASNPTAIIYFVGAAGSRGAGSRGRVGRTIEVRVLCARGEGPNFVGGARGLLARDGLPVCEI